MAEKRPLGGTPIGTGRREGYFARLAELVLGAWLFISAFLWPHTDAARTNTWICGALIVIVAIVAIRIVSARWVDTAVATWVVISPLFIDHASVGTVVHNVTVGLIVGIISLMPSRGEITPEGRIAKLRH